MLILTVRTDKPESELGLYEDDRQLAYIKWEAHRQLAETIHLKLKELLDGQKKQYQELEGIVAYKGPGSYTGLRIGLSVANALADSLAIPIAGGSGEDWLEDGTAVLQNDENDKQLTPEYGQDFFTTKPVK